MTAGDGCDVQRTFSYSVLIPNIFFRTSTRVVQTLTSAKNDMFALWVNIVLITRDTDWLLALYYLINVQLNLPFISFVAMVRGYHW